MRRGKTTIGKDVLSLADARKIHSVKDLVIGPENDSVVALLVDEGGLLSSSLVVPIEQVKSFGRDAVVISDSAAVVPADKYQPVAAILGRKDRLVGKRVFTETGDQQGSISDIYFDETGGRIRGFEVSGGLLGDAARGTSWLAVEEVTGSGPDVLYVREEAVQKLESQVGGLQGALESAKTKVSSATDSAGQRIGEAGDRAGQRLDETGQRLSSARDRTGAAMSDSQREQSLVGRRAGTDVTDDSGSILVPAGQRITQQHVDEARSKDRLPALTASATAGAAREAGETAAHAIGQAGDVAGSAWDRFMAKVNEWTDSTGQRLDEDRTKKRLSDIEDAVGRPVTKVILDRQDNVILNLGDIITHESIQRSYEARGLDSLLSNVYKGTVDFTKDEMRAPSTAARTAITIERASGEAPFLDEMQQQLQRAEKDRQRQREQGRSQAESDRERREREREERAAEREQAKEAQRAEAEAARATASTSGASRSSGSSSSSASGSSSPRTSPSSSTSTTTR